KLMLAAVLGDDAAGAKAALDQGLDVNGTIPLQPPFRPIELALLFGGRQVLQALVEHKANLGLNNWSSVRLATRLSDIEATKLLITTAGPSLPKNTSLVHDAADRMPSAFRDFLTASIRAEINGTAAPGANVLASSHPIRWTLSPSDPANTVVNYL